MGVDKQYLNIVSKILSEGTWKPTRQGIKKLSIHKATLDIDMSEGFPLLTTKHVGLKSIATELFWFLKGDTKVQSLQNQKVNIWNGDAYNFFKKNNKFSALSKEQYLELLNKDHFTYQGDLGKVYGYQWRNFGGSFDQIDYLQKELISNPHSTRLKLNAWNPCDFEQQALPPCHDGFTLYVDEIDGKRFLSLDWSQRSVDVPLGLPYNIASYAMLLHLFCKTFDFTPYKLTASLTNVHIYENQIPFMEQQLNRDVYILPTLDIVNFKENVWDYNWNDLKLSNYHNAGKLNIPLTT